MNLLPILDSLRTCDNNEQRSDWLFQCPPGIIVTHHMEIRKVLADAGFGAGIACLDVELAEQMATRMKDGSTRPNVRFSTHLARVDLAIAARKGAS